MRKVLLAWVGNADLNAPEHLATSGTGPIAQALTAGAYDEAYLLSNYPKDRVDRYVAWLELQVSTRFVVRPKSLTSPTHFGDIYHAARELALEVSTAAPSALTYHLSPGTPAMAAVWILLGKTRFPGRFIESSKDHGVRDTEIPFDIAADFLPDLLAERDRHLGTTAAAPSPPAPEFDDLIHRSRVMARLIDRARRVARHDVPVLVEGESGTGKEMLARAIHRASPRARGPFVAVNCGAIPPTLVESQLFGHEKGAFTGANHQHKGYFEAADSGTLFLDELGELPPSVQVALLRVLQEGEIVRVGATQPVRVSVRIIAATHKDMVREVEEGRFREDLFFRLAVALLKVPPLRERPGDIKLLTDHLLDIIHREGASDPDFEHKTLAAAARNLLDSHPWPGNIRELANTLQRAAIWTEGPRITGEDVREALLPLRAPKSDLLSLALGDGFDIHTLVGDVIKHYLQRAMTDANGNKTQAAKLLGLPNYQTLTNWLKKYGVQ